MDTQWYHTRNDEKVGPVSAADLLQLAANRQILPDDLVWKEGMPDWVPFQRAFPTPPGQRAPAAQSSGAQSSDLAFMNKFLLMAPVLRYLTNGRFFRHVFAISFRVLAVLVVVLGLYTSAKTWGGFSDMKVSVAFAFIFVQICLLVAMYMVVNVLLIRASDIARLPVSEFMVIPIVSIFFRTSGELSACCIGMIGVAVSVSSLFGAGNDALEHAMASLPGIGGVGEWAIGFGDSWVKSVIGAIVVLGAFGFCALFVLAFYYLLAEATVLLVDIAHNIRALRDAAQPHAEMTGSGLF